MRKTYRLAVPVLLLSAAVATGDEDYMPKICPELDAIEVDADGDGSFSLADKLAIQLWIDNCGGNLEVLLANAVVLRDGRIDASEFLSAGGVATPVPADTTAEASESSESVEVLLDGASGGTCADCTGPEAIIVEPGGVYTTIKAAVLAANADPNITIICVRPKAGNAPYEEATMTVSSQHLTIIACNGDGTPVAEPIPISRLNTTGLSSALITVYYVSFTMKGFEFRRYEKSPVLNEGSFVYAYYSTVGETAPEVLLEDCNFGTIRQPGGSGGGLVNTSSRAVRIASYASATSVKPAVTVRNCNFHGSRESDGGGLRIAGTLAESSDTVGGYYTTITIDSCLFEGFHKPTGVGGGVLVRTWAGCGQNHGRLVVNHSEAKYSRDFEFNRAQGGAGLYAIVRSLEMTGSGVYHRVSFWHNVATGGTGYAGGGMYCNIIGQDSTETGTDQKLTIAQGEFMENQALQKTDGAGAYVQLGPYTDTVSMDGIAFGGNDRPVVALDDVIPDARDGCGLYMQGYAASVTFGGTTPLWENRYYHTLERFDIYQNGTSSETSAEHKGMGAYIDIAPKTGSASAVMTLNNAYVWRNGESEAPGVQAASGALHITARNGMTYKLAHGGFEENVNAQRGGGLHIDQYAVTGTSDVMLQGIEFVGDVAEEGGAMYLIGPQVAGSAVVLENCFITTCTAIVQGGAVACREIKGANALAFTNCTFRFNEVENDDCADVIAILDVCDGVVEVGNSIVWGNNNVFNNEDFASPQFATNFPASRAIKNCLDEKPVSWNGAPTNIDQDPVFVSGQGYVIYWDAATQSGSPCVFAGYKQGEYASVMRMAPRLDIRNETRYYLVDIGCYEIPPFTGAVPNFTKQFVRGNTNCDGSINIADATCILGYHFNGTVTNLYCMEALDVNHDLKLDLADSTWLLSYLFAGGPPPYAPFPYIGTDPPSPSPAYKWPCELYPAP